MNRPWKLVGMLLKHYRQKKVLIPSRVAKVLEMSTSEYKDAERGLILLPDPSLRLWCMLMCMDRYPRAGDKVTMDKKQQMMSATLYHGILKAQNLEENGLIESDSGSFVDTVKTYESS